MENNKLLTAGEFAERAGLTIRTIRYYDNKGLLKPTSYSDAGYRLYCEKDFVKLQKILILKYLGMSLSDIAQMINENVDEKSLKESLRTQRELLEKRVINTKLVLKTVKETEGLLSKNNFSWGDVIKIIDSINQDKEVVSQYSNSNNLTSRINIHDEYSTNKYGWHKWLWDNMNIRRGMRILEIGCGNGELWNKNSNRIPQGCNIYLSDIAEGMLDDAKIKLKDVNYNFIYVIANGEDIPYEDGYFDVVIANHVLYHIKDRGKALREIKRVLKVNGTFYASTIGNNHMKEIHELCSEFDERIDFSFNKVQQAFGLETGKEQLVKLFHNVETIRYDDSLIVTESQPLIDYIYSTIGNVKEILCGQEEEFKRYVDNKIEKEKGIKIVKYSGMFKCE